MSTYIFLPIIVALSVGLLTLSITVRTLSKELDEIKDELEQCQRKLRQLDFFDISDHERRLDRLEEALELKEYFEEEPLNKEENE